MIRIAICDDEPLAIEVAKQIAHETAKVAKREIEVDTYQNGTDIINRLLNKKEPLDILMLDIDMPMVTGLEIAEKLRVNDEQVIIIFVSAHEKFVFHAIEYTPFRYIRKNFIKTELPIALQAAFTTIVATEDKEITVKTENGDQRIMISKIIYYEVFGRKLVIYLKNGAEVVTRKTIKEMQTVIPHEHFIALHRSCVVNADFVKM
jgi:DNA-binding LytR/AlgR family response regulator